MKKLFYLQSIILSAGTIFAWGNFTVEMARFLRSRGEPLLGCSGAVVANPFYTPCFFGAIFFTLALAVSLVILKKELCKK